MLAIYKREVKSYYTNVLGFLFAAFLLFILGIYFTAYNVAGGSPYLGYSLGNISFAFLILVPIITMRSMSEERRTKTDQLILTSPVSVTQIVLGKYFALLTVFAVPMLIICFYPLILSSMGTISYAMAYSAILAFFLVGCVNLAIGMFISSMTESPVLSAILTFIVLFADYLISGIAGFFTNETLGAYIGFAALILALAIILFMMTKSVALSAGAGVVLEIGLAILYVVKPSVFAGTMQSVFNALDVTVRMDDFINGVFNTSNIIYLVSVAALFVFLTVQSVEKRRWS